MVGNGEAEIRSKVSEIFTSFLKRPISSNDNISRKNEDNWDSLMHIDLCFTIEDAFDIIVPSELIESLDSQDAFVIFVLNAKKSD